MAVIEKVDQNRNGYIVDIFKLKIVLTLCSGEAAIQDLTHKRSGPCGS